MGSSTTKTSDGESLACPRCNSRDTKFCYFNNYSTAQPRHFCKNCKRYWTAGGSLRNVPVGGGLRKSKKSKLSKHGKDLLSANREEFSSPGKAATTLPLASPSSSADGVVDETFASPVAPLLPYRPTFDFASENQIDSTPLPAISRQFDYSNLTHNPCVDHGNAFLPKSQLLYQRLPHDACNGFHQPHTSWYENVGQPQCNYGEISSEPSQAQENCHQSTVLSSMQTRSYSALQRHEHERREIKSQTEMWQSSEDAPVMPNKQGNVQCSVEEHAFSHDGIMRNVSSIEDDDEGLGNVINVRYPYDWEQVSEVLFGGAPDFFQMPTF